MSKLRFIEKITLDYVLSRNLCNDYYFSGDEIARDFNIKENTAVAIVNNLIKKGYLIKKSDGSIEVTEKRWPKTPWLNQVFSELYKLEKEMKNLKSDFDCLFNAAQKRRDAVIKKDAIFEKFCTIQNELTETETELDEVIKGLQK